MRGGHCTAYIEDAPDSFIQLEPFLIRSSNPSSELIGLIVLGNVFFAKSNVMKRYMIRSTLSQESRLALEVETIDLGKLNSFNLLDLGFRGVVFNALGFILGLFQGRFFGRFK